ncbi:hypothetical protein ASE68_10625 [Agromyces sp. Leaf222]|nr:hypothetical protein ASE68_10625 [Agromyces sp. Leaf222]
MVEWRDLGLNDERHARWAFRAWSLISLEGVELLSAILDSDDAEWEMWASTLTAIVESATREPNRVTSEERVKLEVVAKLLTDGVELPGPANWRSRSVLEATAPDRIDNLRRLVGRVGARTEVVHEPASGSEPIASDFDLDLELFRLTAAEFATRSSAAGLELETFSVETTELRAVLLPLDNGWRVRLISFGAYGTYDIEVQFTSGRIESARMQLPEDDQADHDLDIEHPDGPPVRIRVRRSR